MGSNETLFFERNNYFKGKHLAVRDFQQEQDYFVKKQRLLNYALFGQGVVAGFDVVAVDNTRLSVESGLAIDDIGREIVLPQATMKAINVFEGYDSLEDDKEAFLCLSYDEEQVEASHSITESDLVSFNRVRENPHLFLTNQKPKNSPSMLASLLETKKEIFSQNGVTISVTVPNYVNVTEELILSVSIEQFHVEKTVSVDFSFDVEGFASIKETKPSISYYNATNPDHMETFYVHLLPQEEKMLGKLRLLPDSFSLKIGEEDFSIPFSYEFTTKIISGSIREQLMLDYSKRNIDNYVNSVSYEPIYLAKLRIKKGKDAGFVESLEKLPFRQYVMTNGMQYLLDLYSKEALRNERKKVNSTNEDLSTKAFFNSFENESFSEDSNKQNFLKENSFGVENIVIDKDARGKVYYSSEILHNLGPGEVSYNIGFEIPLDTDEKTVVFGEENLFEKGPYALKAPQVVTSIASYNDRGSFRIAIKLLDRINAGNLKIHWYATKHGGYLDKNLLKKDRISLEIFPQKVTLKPRDTIRLRCEVKGVEDQNVTFKVSDEKGGFIDDTGLYTAPSKPGVYEVTATSVASPNKIAKKYIVVSTKEGM